MTETHTMLFVTFDDTASARAAYREIKEVHGVRQAAVMERTADGLLDVPESWVRGAGAATVLSGVVGALVGLIGGPIGAFLGWGAGTALGGGAEYKRYSDATEGLMVFSRGLDDSSTMLIVELVETDPAVADAIAARHGGRLVRRPAAEVEAEVRAAQEEAEESLRAEHEAQHDHHHRGA
ncbi:histidine kinase [Kitasatospora sp. NPDC094015]|uniref:histidine kinase n=1 Tax=Kitasatospora sp. NPDC094015 TaxID=3155205 RepID=UPI00331ECDA0